jgi:hypothetical protein
MPETTYRVTQWMPGDGGQGPVGFFARDRVVDPVAVLVHGSEEASEGGAEIVGSAPTGVAATDDIGPALSAISDICDDPRGWIAHADLGLVHTGDRVR